MNRTAIIGLFLFMLIAVTGGAFAVQHDRGTPPVQAKQTLASVLREAAPSVYRVVFRTVDGHEYGGATAWVVAPHTLATNVHVATAFSMRPKTTKMMVRSGGAAPSTFEVKSVRLHPGFDTFALLWQWYQPKSGEGSHSGTKVTPAGTACDVALLEVSTECLLAPPLRLATNEALFALQPGAPIGYVGYPSENLVLDGSPLRQPSPQIQVGHITALTNHMGESGSAATNQLIQHSCRGTGGSSGSPLLDDSGCVIGLIHAGNFDSTGWRRIPSAVGVNFAQRIDLLQELLDDREVEATVSHAARWARQLKRLYVSSGARDRAKARAEALGQAADRARSSKPGSRLPIFEPAQEMTFDLRPAAGIPSKSSTMRLSRPGTYVMLVWTYGPGDVALEMEAQLSEDSKRHPSIVGTSERGVRLYEARFPERGSWAVRASVEERMARVHIELHRCKERPESAVPHARHLAEILDAWQAHWSDTFHLRFEMELLHEETMQVRRSWSGGPLVVSTDIALKEAGLHLVHVEAPTGVLILLERPGGEGDALLATEALDEVDARPVYVAAAREVAIRATLGPSASLFTEVRLRIYRAKPVR